MKNLDLTKEIKHKKAKKIIISKKIKEFFCFERKTIKINIFLKFL